MSRIPIARPRDEDARKSYGQTAYEAWLVEHRPAGLGLGGQMEWQGLTEEKRRCWEAAAEAVRARSRVARRQCATCKVEMWCDLPDDVDTAVCNVCAAPNGYPRVIRGSGWRKSVIEPSQNTAAIRLAVEILIDDLTESFNGLALDDAWATNALNDLFDARDRPEEYLRHVPRLPGSVLDRQNEASPSTVCNVDGCMLPAPHTGPHSWERTKGALTQACPSSGEPKLHSHITECLPDDHPLAFESIHCIKCEELIHAGNNECVQTWFEFENANVCAVCVGRMPDVLGSNRWPRENMIGDVSPATVHITMLKYTEDLVRWHREARERGMRVVVVDLAGQRKLVIEPNGEVGRSMPDNSLVFPKEIPRDREDARDPSRRGGDLRMVRNPAASGMAWVREDS